jgi:hypothetical protein
VIDPDIRHDTAHSPAVPDRTVRQFTVLLSLLLGTFAVRDFLARGATTSAVLLAVAATAVITSGLIRPGTIRPIFTGAMVLTTPIRIVVSAALLRVMYYGIFTPMAVVFRLIGRDALGRRRVNAPTYWAPKATPSDVKSYFRQS